MKTTTHCATCGALLELYPSQVKTKGSKRNFCNMKCLGVFRRSQTGTAAGRWTHGGKGTRLYRIWRGMKQRCLNPKHPEFYLWGGRGITVCAEWNADFVPFRDWSLASGYADYLEIDRRDNNGNYEPDNCRWVTEKVNCANKRTTKRTPDLVAKVITMVGEGMKQPEIASALSVSLSTIHLAIHEGACQ